MKDVEIIGMLKSYVKNTLVGMGALKGAPCQCVIDTNPDGTHTVTMKWVDNSGVSHEDSFNVLNGEVGSMEDISNVQITSIADGQVLAYDSATQKWINTTNSATVASLANIGDVQFTTLVDGQSVVWDNAAGKWKNANVTITVDNVLDNTSENPVQNKVIVAALADKADSATTLAGYNITNAYTKTETDTAITTEIEKLDVSDSAIAGDYVTAVSETDGKITVTRETADTTPTSASTKMITSGGVYTALDDKANKGTSLSDYGITNAYTKTETDTAITTEIEKLDVSDSATAGSYVTAVNETDGKITVTREAADATPTSASTKMLTSGGAFTALASKVDSISVNGVAQTITNSAVDLDVATNLITEAQWTQIQSILT